MKRHRDDDIVRAYSSYLNDVKTTLEVEEVEWSKYAAQDLFEDTSAIRRRVDTLLTALAKPRVDRHCQAFVPCEVPEIWEDDIACKSFEDSFFESLAHASSARTRSGSAMLILDSLNLSVPRRWKPRQLSWTLSEMRIGIVTTSGKHPPPSFPMGREPARSSTHGGSSDASRSTKARFRSESSSARLMAAMRDNARQDVFPEWRLADPARPAGVVPWYSDRHVLA